MNASPRLTNREARDIAARLSRRMLMVLVEHGDGPQPIIAGASHQNTVLSLRNRKLLKVHATAIRPKETMATELGRQIIAAALSIEADKLMALQNFRDAALSLESTTPAERAPGRSEPVR